jgi:hypothetical protein
MRRHRAAIEIVGAADAEADIEIDGAAAIEIGGGRAGREQRDEAEERERRRQERRASFDCALRAPLRMETFARIVVTY